MEMMTFPDRPEMAVRGEQERHQGKPQRANLTSNDTPRREGGKGGRFPGIRERAGGPLAARVLTHHVRKEPERAIGIFYDRVARNQERGDEFRRDAKEKGVPGELVELMLEEPGIFKTVTKYDMERAPENVREFIRAATILKRLARVPDPDRK